MVNTNNIKIQMYRKALNFHQNIYELSSDWNKYKLDEDLHLKGFISYALYGPPEYKEVCINNIDDTLTHSANLLDKSVNQIFEKIVVHGTHLNELNRNKEILCNVLYNFTYDESALLKSDTNSMTKLISIYPIFKVKKFLKNNNESQIWFIDIEARVYKSWNDYLRNNNLPKCAMITPINGIYQADLRELWSDKESMVCIIFHENKKSKITTILDSSSNILSIGCIGVAVAGIFNPISASIITCATAGGLISGLWNGSRATYKLFDLSAHEQPISITNQKALPHWLGMTFNTFGVISMGSSALLSKAIRTGISVNKGAEIALNTFIIGNAVINSSAVVYSSIHIVNKYKETGEISITDLMHLSSHIFFFCHSIFSIKFVSEIIKSKQNQMLTDYENSLRYKRHKIEFRRLVKNTRNNIPNTVDQNSEIIRGLNKIDDKNEFFSLLARNSKVHGKLNNKVSFHNNQIKLNDINYKDIFEFKSLIQNNLTLKNPSNIQSSGLSPQPSQKTTLRQTKILAENNIRMVQSFYEINKILPDFSASLKIFENIESSADKQKIFKGMLKLSLKLMNATSRKVVTKNLICKILNFFWKFIKNYIESEYPNYDISSEKCCKFIETLIDQISDSLNIEYEKWLNKLIKYLSLHSDLLTQGTTSKNEIDADFIHFLQNDSEIDKNNRDLLDIHEMISMKDEIVRHIQELKSNAIIKDSVSSILNEERKLYINELNQIILIHEIQFPFKLIDFLHALTGILIDLKRFKKKYIIFYKLIKISIILNNIIIDKNFLQKDTLVKNIHILWSFVKINLKVKRPRMIMISVDPEDLIVKLIIDIYQSQICEPEKWSIAYDTFKNVCL